MEGTVVIPGYHPDPSVCRAGEDYYLVTSTFEYFPGVPVFTSRDLRHWRQIGNVLERPSQLHVRTGLDGASGGIYAPTIRHHGGRFWMATTNIHDIARGQLIVNAENPAGPWSDPVYTEGLIGIDPDIAWDESGACRMTWKDVIRGGISQAIIDPETGAVLSEPVELWRGTGGAHPEGPHVFARAGWWYLVIAEGGTAEGHMVTVARSRSIDGPYVADPANPILTRRSLTEGLQAAGHADFVETAGGEWALVHLGTRPRGSFPKWHTNGRETFLAGVEWVDDWPVVVPDRYAPTLVDRGFEDEFRGERLHPRWIAPGEAPDSFARTGDGGLALARGRHADDATAARLLVARAVDEYWTAEVVARGDISLTVRIDDAHQAMIQRVGETVTARVVIGPMDQVIATRHHVDAAVPLRLRAIPYAAERGSRQGPDRIVLALGNDGEPSELASFDGRYLSTQVAGGFTGRVIGIEALGDGVIVETFRYHSEGTRRADAS